MVLEKNLPPTMPAVLVNTRYEGERYSSLMVDNYGGACAMVRHLVGRGHRRIAMVAGPEANFDARERLAGYTDTLAELVPEARAQVLRGDFSEESGYRAGRQRSWPRSVWPRFCPTCSRRSHSPPCTRPSGRRRCRFSCCRLCWVISTNARGAWWHPSHCMPC